MSFQSQLPQVLRFGVFEVDVRAGELRKNGVKVKLQEQPFQVLCMLLEHPGELVTREELRHRLWSADTFVDFDRSVNAAIKRLRDALGESADAPLYIETMARRGYRFIAQNGRFAPSETEVAARPEQRESSFLRPRIAFAWFSLIGIAVLILAVWWHPSGRIEVIERKLTSNSWENPVSSVAVSPDGKYIAYADNTGIYLKELQAGETHPVSLPRNFFAVVDAWFPDGTHLLVTRKEQSGKPSLWSLALFGGSPHELMEDASGASFSPDGSHIAFLRAELPYVTAGQETWVMRSDGTDPLKVASEKPNSWVGVPTWSPDSKRIAYFRSNSGWAGGTSSIEVNEWQKAHAETLFSDGRLGSAILWLPDGRLTYALDEDPPNQQTKGVWIMSPQQSSTISTHPVRITRGPGDISQFSRSTDGKVLISLRSNQQTSISIGTLATDGTRLLSNRRLTMDENFSLPFSWTPDSKAVLFVRGDVPQIFKQPIDQPLAESLMTSPDGHWVSQARLTPDGSEVLYILVPKDAGPNTPSSIYAIPIGGGSSRLVLKDIRIVNLQCARSPSTLCLYSIVKDDTLLTYRFDAVSGKRAVTQQVDPAGFGWSLSPDGSQRALVAESRNQGKILLRSTSTGAVRELIAKGWTGLATADWSADGKSLFAASQNYAGEYALLNVTLDGNASVLLRSRNPFIWAIPAWNGNLLAIPQQTSTTNAWVVENFR
jgi:DNA-binding winged helix-turn-helix (wHTH) protein/Tol biopolymer transport system component